LRVAKLSSPVRLWRRSRGGRRLVRRMQSTKQAEAGMPGHPWESPAGPVVGPDPTAGRTLPSRKLTVWRTGPTSRHRAVQRCWELGNLLGVHGRCGMWGRWSRGEMTTVCHRFLVTASVNIACSTLSCTISWKPLYITSIVTAFS
jgi:hypothetical protein